MLTALIPPATQNLMAPETVAERLGTAEDLTDVVEEASRLVARYLRFEPAYSTWRETFAGVSGDRLYLGARPAWSIESVAYRDGAAQEAESYRLERGQFGESAVIRSGSNAWWWSGPAGLDGSWLNSPSLMLAGSPVLPDWSVDYTAGWWLEEMTGEPPAGVERFPPDLRSDFLKIVRWLMASSGSLGGLAGLGISKMTNEGMSVELFSSKDADIDPQTGIPNGCLTSLSLYRRVG